MCLHGLATVTDFSMATLTSGFPLAALCLVPALPENYLRSIVPDKSVPSSGSFSSVQLAQNTDGCNFCLSVGSAGLVPKRANLHIVRLTCRFPFGSQIPEQLVLLILSRSPSSGDKRHSLAHQSFAFIHRSFVLIVRPCRSVGPFTVRFPLS